MTRLTAATLPAPLPYDRAAVTPGIVHLGIGAFHRAHMAVYVDDLLAARPALGHHRRLAAPPRHRAMRCAPQDCLYTVAIRDAAGTHPRVIGSILDILDANTQRKELIVTAGRSAHPHRLADGHREGLLPRSGDRPARPQPPRHCPRSRQPRRADQRPRPDRPRHRAAACRRRRAVHRDELRQPPGQRRDRQAHRHRPRRTALTPTSRAYIERAHRLPLDHGRPHRARHHRRRPRDGVRPQRASRMPGRS